LCGKWPGPGGGYGVGGPWSAPRVCYSPVTGVNTTGFRWPGQAASGIMEDRFGKARRYMAIVLLLVGLTLLIAGAELLVRGASRLAKAVGLPSLIIGLTVVAYGTSAPEFAVSIRAGLTGQTDIAVGNVVGSNTFNVLLILGLSALIVPLAASSQLVRLDVPVMIGVSGLTWLMAADAVVGRLEGLVLSAVMVAYTTILICTGKKRSLVEAAPEKGADRSSGDPRRLACSVVFVIVGLAFLVLGSRWLVQGSIGLARLLGVSELLIGLTIVAAGTSMPEAATSVVASIRGERDIAVGNVVGSNIFNVSAVLGLSAVVAPQGVAIAPSALRFDLPVMTATAIVCLPVFFTGGRISRAEGLLFLLYYVAYVVFLVLHATSELQAALFGTAIVWFAGPLTLVGLALSVLYAIRRRRLQS